MKLYNTAGGIFATEDEQVWWCVEAASWDELVCSGEVLARARAGVSAPAPTTDSLLAPVGSQEVWAAGVTYRRSRSARMVESKDAGGGSFYDRVYSAARPELFFKSSASRVVGPGGAVRIRADARWSVPEPELTLLLGTHGEILGYTAGNDMSSRDIEGENPLYLPQAKVYDGACALGPCVLLAEGPLPATTAIQLRITRDGAEAFAGRTTLGELKRTPEELSGYLYREMSFPTGAYLMTGTGIVPDDSFTLARGDAIEISIEGIGTLRNTVG